MTTLAELRQASLKEQKQKEQQRTPETMPAAVSVETAPVPTPAPVVQAHVTAPAPATNGNGHHAPTAAPVAAPVIVKTPEPAPPPPPAAPDPEAVKAEKFFAQIHETLSHKTLHPSGAKVSADMPPALFHRAKRYCLDHGNITLRQVLIDLLTAYLEEEGY